MDGYPDIIVADANSFYAYNAQLILKTDFPIEIDPRWPMGRVINSPVVGDLDNDGLTDICAATNMGNVYARDSDLAVGFPINSGQQRDNMSDGSAVLLNGSTLGYIAFLGGDGWLYAWETSHDTALGFWRMNGSDPEGTFMFDNSLLLSGMQSDERFPEDRFYCYENPVTSGFTTIRYYLGEPARRVQLRIFSFSGAEVFNIEGTVIGNTDNEVVWNCSDVTPGMYRCIIEIDFDGTTNTAFTDIAVIR